MAKSMRSKREKRLRAIRREMVEPIYEKKEAAKLAVQEAALAAPKLPVRAPKNNAAAAMDTTAETARTSSANDTMDVEMADGIHNIKSLKPIGKRMKKKIQIAKKKQRGKGKIKRKHV